MNNNKIKRAVIITGSEYEDPEVMYPFYRLKGANFNVDIATEDGMDVKGKFGFPVSALLKPEMPIKFSDLKVTNFDLVVIPGGLLAPDKIRQNKDVLNFIKEMFENNEKVVASICHGPWVLISAGVLKGKNATCYPSMIEDLKNAGANYLDEPVVIDGNLITSRRPKDLPVFMEEVVRRFES